MVELEFGLTHVPPSFHRIQSGIFYQTTREPEDRCPWEAPAWPCSGPRTGANPQPSCRVCMYPGRGHRRPTSRRHLTVSIHLLRSGLTT